MTLLPVLIMATHCVATVCLLSFVVQFNKDFNVDDFTQKFYSSSIEVQSLQQMGITEFVIGKFKGVIGDFSTNLIALFHQDPKVSAISIDRELVLSDVQENTPEHLARLFRRQRLRQVQGMAYVFDPSGGIGVDVYILDTGIQLNHPDFSNRVHKVADFTGKRAQEQIDPVGHGTNVAGVVGSETYGVAKKANLYDVKITDKEGRTRMGSLISALNLIVQDSKVTKRPTVIVIPLVMKKNAILNGAVEAVVNEGIPVVVYAGNDNQSACDFSPASASGSLTVGALDAQDNIASFSNWGACVDVYATGVKVLTTGTKNNEATFSSFTSLSAGIAAGAVAYYMGMGDTGPQAVERVVKFSLTDAIPENNLLERSGSVNRVMIFNGEGETNWGPSAGHLL